MSCERTRMRGLIVGESAALWAPPGMLGVATEVEGGDRSRRDPDL